MLSQAELLCRANALAGLTLADLARQHQQSLPPDLRHAKGWVGQFIERLLGASAASKAEPDFPHLGIELKTLPIDPQGKPLESTFVTTIDLLTAGQESWHDAVVYQKLRHVLWVPIQVSCDDLSKRRIGQPLLWQPSAADEAILEADWRELTDMISLGQLELITAKHGRYLQVRPKGANSKALVWGLGADGSKILTLPRGFYCRPQFTQKIINEHFLR